MTRSPVPDYFQEETDAARREQVDWLMRVVGVDVSFFGRVLRTDIATFGAWRLSRAVLSGEHEQTLRKLWHTTLHLLSFLGFQQDRLRELFQGFLPAPRRGEGSPLTPPWRGTTLRAFVETGGLEAIDEVDRWVTGLRFGDPYAA